MKNIYLIRSKTFGFYKLSSDMPMVNVPQPLNFVLFADVFVASSFFTYIFFSGF